MVENVNMGLNRRAFLTGHWTSKPMIGSDCLNNKGVYCQSCKDSCEENAIIFNQMKMGIQLPQIIPNRCTQCKDCLQACPVGAITINKNE